MEPVKGTEPPKQSNRVGAGGAQDAAGSQIIFILVVLVMYGIGRLITPWTTGIAVLVCLGWTISPKSIASDPRFAISAPTVRRTSLLFAGLFLVIGILQIAEHADASELTKDEAAEIRQQNIIEIHKIEAELRDIPPEADLMNRDRYSRLTKLDPGNATYAAKAEHYQAEVEKIDYLADHPTEALKLVKSKWVDRTGFNRIAVVDFTIKNTAGWSIRDPVVTCHFFGNSGTAVSIVSDTIYEEIKAGATRSFRGRKLGFIDGANATSASCSITGANGK